MSRVMKTSDLIDSVRDRAFIPKEDAIYNDDRLISILNEQIDTMLLPQLLSMSEEHLVVSELIPLVQGKSKYNIPYRAVGNKLRDVALKDSAENYYEMSRVSLEELSDYRRSGTFGSLDLFYIQNNQVNLVSSRTSDYENLEMFFYLRPNKLVKDARCPTITSIDTVNGIVTLSSFPSHFSDATQFDFVGARSPNKLFKYDVDRVSVNRTAKTVVFAAADLPEDLAVGDYLSIAEEACVPSMPTEYHPVLAQMAAIFILESMNDTEGLQNALKKLDTMQKGVMHITNDRVEGAPQKINPRHTTLVDSQRRGGKGRRRL